ncbi:tetratricopeptide repeat protein [Micromonospora aurantiaca (nom. illeg.)]|uniref:tetratricopeptide repeat protein n=1 Tax=Micromonospora aurantiaca (nom. illeg.) TaxID=47850 RepID=UPI003EBFB610
MPDLIVSHVPSDTAWAHWLAHEFERCGRYVSLYCFDSGKRTSATEGPDERGAHIVLLLSPALVMIIQDITPAWSRRQRVTPIVVESIPDADTSGTLDLSEFTEQSARQAVHEHFDVTTVDGPRVSRLFGRDRPGYPPDLAPSWRVGPRPAGPVRLGELEQRLPDTAERVTRVVVNGPGTILTEYAHRHARSYARCWSIDGNLAELVSAQLTELRLGQGGDDGDGTGLLLVHNVADATQVQDPEDGTWHLLIATAGPCEPTVDATAPLGSAGRHLIALLKALAPAPVPVRMLTAGAAATPSDVATVLTTPDTTDTLLSELMAAGLLRHRPGFVELTTDGRCNPEPAATGWASNLVALAIDTMDQRDAALEEWLAVLPHAMACLTASANPAPATIADYLDGWERGVIQQPPLTRALSIAVNVTCEAGAPGLGVRLARRLLSLATREGASSEKAQIDALVLLAGALRVDGRLSEACAVVARAERVAAVPVGQSDRSYPLTPPHLLLEKAQVLHESGDDEKALAALDELFQLTAVGLPCPPDLRDRAKCFHAGLRLRHATSLMAAGRSTEAAAEAHDVANQARRLGATNLLVDALRVHGLSRAADQDFDTALRVLAEALRMAEHDDVSYADYVQCEYELADVFHRAGRLSEAADLLTARVAAWRDDTGSLPALLRFNTANLLAAVEQLRNRPRLAIAALRVALACVEPADADAVPVDGHVRLALSSLYMRTGEPWEAAAVVRPASNRLAGDAAYTELFADLEIARARGMHAVGDPSASAVVDETVRAARQALGPDDPRLAPLLWRVVDLLLTMNRARQAWRYADDGVRLSPDDSPERAAALDNLGRVLVAVGRPERALPAAEEAVRMARVHLGDDHIDVGVRRFNLAQVYGLIGRGDDAVREMTEVVRIDTLFYGSDHKEVARDLQALEALRSWARRRP